MNKRLRGFKANSCDFDRKFEIICADSLVSRLDELHEVGVLRQEVEGVELVLEEVVAVEAHSEDPGGDEGDDNLRI